MQGLLILKCDCDYVVIHNIVCSLTLINPFEFFIHKIAVQLRLRAIDTGVDVDQDFCPNGVRGRFAYEFSLL